MIPHEPGLEQGRDGQISCRYRDAHGAEQMTVNRLLLREPAFLEVDFNG
jgi:hypothetical protein